MTTALPPTSHRRIHAKKLGVHLTRLLAERGLSKRGVAAELSTSRSLLTLWCKGQSLPSLEQALELSQAIGDDRILEIVRDGRMVTCPIDGTQFEWRGGGPAVYCSDRCRKVGAAANQRKTRNTSIPKLEGELALLTDRIAAFCGSCEWDGICKTPDCELRAVSPLPLRLAPDVDEVEPWQQGPLTEEGREALSSKSRARWADPEYRERNLAAMQAAGHPAHDERRDEWRAAVAAGRRSA